MKNKLFTKKDDPAAALKWTYQPPKIDGGKQTIDDMSLFVGQYGDYLLTKTGHLVGLLNVSGINLDLLNDAEQEGVFSDYNAFLMSTLGDGVEDSYQFIEQTIPVDMTAYLNGLKARYLRANQDPTVTPFKKELIASYIDHFTQVQNSKAMTTKQHLVVVRVPVKDKAVESLEFAKTALSEKLNQTVRDIETALGDFDISVTIMDNQQVLKTLKDIINFKG
ncbi:TrsD/TraD family conjugative transfer protein [Lacticaseibacillus paracasei]|uniref:TrsD/TraD family conjugative transfer protein n=1 Tax=Lacticaseibacillus paracasei TaxID=1597 RepID=UPI000F43DB12|nr:TrsD/TraD family conjugative transfer protein [Lacticaseibacillus paracasei]RND41252.1 hypothetical protein FAM10859_00673 [Lacticaseibacillus paracasei]